MRKKSPRTFEEQKTTEVRRLSRQPFAVLEYRLAKAEKSRLQNIRGEINEQKKLGGSSSIERLSQFGAMRDRELGSRIDILKRAIQWKRTKGKPSRPSELGAGIGSKAAGLPSASSKGISRRRKPGPKRDLATARRVAEVVKRVCPKGNWRARLDAVCKALDEDGIPVSPRWKRLEPPRLSWSNNLSREIVVKAIQRRLDIAKAKKFPNKELRRNYGE